MAECREEDCTRTPAPGRQGRCSTHYWRDYRASRRDELNENYKKWAKARGSRRALMSPDELLQNRLWNAAKRARSYNAEVLEFTLTDYRRLERRQGKKCYYCKLASSKVLQLEHVIPLYQGGRHAVGNLVLACADCNKSKGSNFPSEWKYWDLKYGKGSPF